MPFLILGFVALIALVLLSRAFARMKTKDAARWSRITLGLAAAIFGGLLTLRGLAVIGAPVATFGIGMMAVGAGLRPKPGQKKQTAATMRDSTMSRAEALEILGLEEGADTATIKAAYRELMKRAHPDAGGTVGLSKRLTEARDLLLGD